MNARVRFQRGTLSALLLLLALIAFAGCSGDSPTANNGPGDTTPSQTGVIQGDLNPKGGDFEYVSATNGDPDNPIEGPFTLRGNNIRYDVDAGELVVDLTVINDGENSFGEAVAMTFLGLLPDGVTVENPDNAESGVGAMINFEFENDDAEWTPGEESIARETRFGVAEDVAIGFTARIDVGMSVGMGSIGGIVWNDENDDGMMGTDEGGLAGVKITLSQEGADDQSTSSGEDGTYRFDGLDAGFYTVRKHVESDDVSINPLSGATTPTTIHVILVEDIDGMVVPFLAANFGCKGDDGSVDDGAITGVVYNDANGNKMRDDGEEGIAGIKVSLVSGPDEITSTSSDENGNYLFAELAPGNYAVVKVAQAGWIPTTPNIVAVKLGSDDTGPDPKSVDHVDFGCMMDEDEATGAIGGIVWNDANGNKQFDKGEGPMAGVAVNIGETQAVTNELGIYIFDGLAAGEYTVEKKITEGYMATTPAALTIKLADVGGVIDNVFNAHFGCKMIDGGGPTPGSIGGVVYNDINMNKERDEGEKGIPGVMVTMAAEGLTFLPMTTNENGEYLFEGLNAGNYTVTKVTPEGWTASTSTTGEIKLNEVEGVVDSVTDVDFGCYESVGTGMAHN